MIANIKITMLTITRVLNKEAKQNTYYSYNKCISSPVNIILSSWPFNRQCLADKKFATVENLVAAMEFKRIWTT